MKRMVGVGDGVISGDRLGTSKNASSLSPIFSLKNLSSSSVPGTSSNLSSDPSTNASGS